MKWFYRKKKQMKDLQALRKYKQRLEAERKPYEKKAEIYTDTDRKSRCMGAGECVIQLLEQVAELNMKHKLIPGSLEWVIGQQKVQDDTGRKGFRYTVLAHVMADEPRWTAEEIRKEIEDTRKRMRLETAAMFEDEEEKADG